MGGMSEAEYLELRLEDQIEWYSSKSQSAQHRFKVARVVELVAALAIPFIAGIATARTIAWLQWLIAILGLVVGISASLIALYDWQENWIRYRSTAEGLKHEKFAYLTAIGPYANDDRFAVLVERVEGLVSTEHSKWQESHSELKGESHG